MSRAQAPRIALIHALAASVAPIHAAFAQAWPEARTFDLLDTSLSVDLAAEGELTETMIERFKTLAIYAAGTADRILFTCSAFGPAIDAASRSVSIPVLKPNTGAFEAALNLGRRIGLLTTFEASSSALAREILEQANARGQDIHLRAHFCAGALSALQSGDPEEHDIRLAEASLQLGDVDVVVLGQFSAARAAAAVAAASARPVITTPLAAVRAIRAMTSA